MRNEVIYGADPAARTRALCESIARTAAAGGVDIWLIDPRDELGNIPGVRHYFGDVRKAAEALPEVFNIPLAPGSARRHVCVDHAHELIYGHHGFALPWLTRIANGGPGRRDDWTALTLATEDVTSLDFGSSHDLRRAMGEGALIPADRINA